jgi:flavin-binding protein dodecin
MHIITLFQEYHVRHGSLSGRGDCEAHGFGNLGKEPVMTDRIYRVAEVVGTLPGSTDPAIRNAWEDGARTVEHIDWFGVTQVRGPVAGSSVGHAQVALTSGFRLDPEDAGA